MSDRSERSDRNDRNLDPAALRRVLLDLQVAVDDADAVAIDMLRPPRRRRLGPVLQRSQYREARGKVISQIAYLLRLTEEPQAPPNAIEH